MNKGIIFSLDAFLAAIIVVIILYLIFNQHEIYTIDKVLYNYGSSSLMVLDDEVGSENTTIIMKSLNNSINPNIDYNLEITYYTKSLNIRKVIEFGSDYSNSSVIVRNLYWTGNGPAIAIMRLWYYE